MADVFEGLLTPGLCENLRALDMSGLLLPSLFENGRRCFGEDIPTVQLAQYGRVANPHDAAARSQPPWKLESRASQISMEGLTL